MASARRSARILSVDDDPNISDVVSRYLVKDGFDRLLGFDSGADDYAAKPFSPRELTAGGACGAAPGAR